MVHFLIFKKNDVLILPFKIILLLSRIPGFTEIFSVFLIFDLTQFKILSI